MPLMSDTLAPARRRRSFAVVTAVLALLAGLLTATTAADAATKYPYKPPVEISVVNVGKDYAEIVFRTVTGAPTYKIRAIGGGQTVITSTGAEGFWTVTGLKPSTKYEFTVAVEQPPTSSSPSKKQLSAWSSKKATATTNPASYLDAPIDVATKKDPSDITAKNGQRPYSIDLMWLAPAGFDPAIHQFQIDWAEDQAMKTNKGSLRVDGSPVVDVSPPVAADAPVEVQAEAPVETPVGEPAEAPVETPVSEPAEAPSSDPAQTPASDQSPAPASVAPQDTSSPAASDVPAPAQSDPSASQEATPATAQAAGSGQPRVVLLSAPLPAAPNVSAQRYWAQVPNLAPNTNWYMRVKLVNRADGSTVSERSEATMVKTLSPKGYIDGSLQVPKEQFSHYVVTAYANDEVQDQVRVDANGNYRLTVRPGGYQVQAIYTGAGNWTTRWATGNPDVGGRTRTDPSGGAAVLAVQVGQVTTAPVIKPTQGYSVSGDIDCPGAQDSCAVTVSAMSDWGGTSTVVRQATSSSGGSYTIDGLAPGSYRLRVAHTENRYKVLQLNVTVGNGPAKASGSLANRTWVKQYKLKISGTKRVGKTLKVSSKAWIASELPTVRAVQKCHWQRNGVDIPGATSCTYKLISADRGKSVRVVVNNYRYGFAPNSKASTAYRIG